MNPQHEKTAHTARAISPLAILVVLAAVLVALYAALAAISFRFGPGSEATERPIPTVLGLLGFAFVCYLIAMRVALRVNEGTRLLVAILLTSVLIRAAANTWGQCTLRP